MENTKKNIISDDELDLISGGAAAAAVPERCEKEDFCRYCRSTPKRPVLPGGPDGTEGRRCRTAALG